MQAELAFLADVRAGRFRLVDDLEPDLDRIAELVERYADLPLGTVDASVVALIERLELREVATLDRRDFSVVRPGTRPPSPCSRSRHEPAVLLQDAGAGLARAWISRSTAATVADRPRNWPIGRMPGIPFGGGEV